LNAIIIFPSGHEDCLWLNVYTRDLVAKKKRPVLVFIHGGNFVRGSAADYDPDYILDEDVVLVTINYRLGMFGFLSTEDEHASGNYGMLDQVGGSNVKQILNHIQTHRSVIKVHITRSMRLYTIEALS
jgi:carboxylesterase type B